MSLNRSLKLIRAGTSIATVSDRITESETSTVAMRSVRKGSIGRVPLPATPMGPRRIELHWQSSGTNDRDHRPLLLLGLISVGWPVVVSYLNVSAHVPYDIQVTLHDPLTVVVVEGGTDREGPLYSQRVSDRDNVIASGPTGFVQCGGKEDRCSHIEIRTICFGRRHRCR